MGLILVRALLHWECLNNCFRLFSSRRYCQGCHAVWAWSPWSLGQHRGKQLGLFSFLRALKCQEIIRTQEDALEISTITPKRETESSIWNSLTCDAYMLIFKMSFSVSWKHTGLDSPIEEKMKHRSQTQLFVFCLRDYCQSVSEAEPATCWKINCGAYEQSTTETIYPCTLRSLGLWHSFDTCGTQACDLLSRLRFL